MRSVSVRACGAALLLLLVLVSAMPVVADDSPPTTESRIHVPVGVTAEGESRSIWERFLVWLQGRIQPPVG